jgi:dipeptide/tripeptide permease
MTELMPNWFLGNSAGDIITLTISSWEVQESDFLISSKQKLSRNHLMAYAAVFVAAAVYHKSGTT